MKYEKDVYGTGVRLKFSHKVMLHTDSCLRRRSMMLCYDNSMYIMPVLHLPPMQPWALSRIRHGGIEGIR